MFHGMETVLGCSTDRYAFRSEGWRRYEKADALLGLTLPSRFPSVSNISIIRSILDSSGLSNFSIVLACRILAGLITCWKVSEDCCVAGN